ncbi:ABC transporter ATP-binding protein [Actinorhabdospora filicis]|uniref:ABC transporter ATP-binding protein n=1 Tax=Actinorhabdospora filicis TaxID=1785913 RepID=A0A9W6SGB3_9ACTN|nr:ABC transporter ATP-binding protein [Actinorhabdospora filicis]GLZ75783.1 ABC transporter ATP-binding protein [Actinorhabdospora filicis]
MTKATSVAAAREPGSRAVRTRGLSKSYGKGVLAVDGLDLDVPYGAVFGFLGPNGCGKTTTIRMLLGLIAATDGTAEVLGEPVPERSAVALPRVGALVEGPAFHPYLSGADNLRRLDAVDRTTDPATAEERVSAALDRVGLVAAARKRYRQYSLGMKQRLAIAGALLRPRELLILDEPTNGLDPQGTREVRSLIAQLAADGVTVMLSTHLLSEVEQVCSHVAVMHKGKLITQSSLADLRASAVPGVRVETASPEAAAEVLREEGLADVAVAPGAATALLGGAEPEKLVDALVRAGVPVRGFAVVRPDLEDLFVSLTGEGFDVSG